MAWDVTCVDSLAKSHVEKAAKGAELVAEDAERVTAGKYAHLDQHIFHGIAFETLGFWGPSAPDILGWIGRRRWSTPDIANNGFPAPEE